MATLQLFEDLYPRKIIISFEFLSDISDFNSSLKGKILQIKDISNPRKTIIINFDLEGRIMSIKLGGKSLDSEVKILERSFNGKFYIYSQNCKNLNPNNKSVYRYYDYYNETIGEDLELSKFLIDSVTSFLKKLSDIAYRSNDKIILLRSKPLRGKINSSCKFKNLSNDLIRILENSYKLYDWKGLLKERVLVQKIYSNSVNVLPPEVRPDQNPIFIILQLTQGCWIQNTRGPCKFCNSYKNIDYREKDIKGLKGHIKQIKDNTGRGWKYIKKIFLSDADPLHTEIDSEIYLKFLRKEIPNMDWYESFISTPTILSKSINKWKNLMKLGLKKVYWGVESADDRILGILGKPQNRKTLYKAASLLNKIGINYVVILLSGISNFDYKNSHIKETVKFIKDIECSDIYISRFAPQPGTEIFNLIKKGRLKFPSFMEREEEHRKIIRMIKSDHFIITPNIRGTYGVQFNQ